MNTDLFYPNVSGIGQLYYNDDSYTIKYNGNGGVGNVEDQTVTSDSDFVNLRLHENRFEKDGYDFIGWNTMPNGTGAWYSDEQLIHKSELKNLSLFAQWREIKYTDYYAELDYLYNDGVLGSTYNKQGVINTGFYGVGTGDIRVKCKYMTVQVPLSSVFALTDNNGTGDNRFQICGNSINFGARTINTINTAGTVLEVDVQRINARFDARTKLESGNWVESTHTNAGGAANNDVYKTSRFFTIFARDTNLTAGKYAIYYAQIWGTDGSLARDFVPCYLVKEIPADSGRSWDNKKHITGELGMWEKVEGKFYSNSNIQNGKEVGYFTNPKLVMIFFHENGGTGEMPVQAFLNDGVFHSLNLNRFKNGNKKFIGWNSKADGTGLWFYDGYRTNTFTGGVYDFYAQWESEAGLLSTDYFEPVNYILGGGSKQKERVEYIDTLLHPCTSSKVDIKFNLMSRWENMAAGIFGGSDSWESANSFELAYFYGHANNSPAYALQENSLQFTVDGKNNINFKNADLTIDDVFLKDTRVVAEVNKVTVYYEDGTSRVIDTSKTSLSDGISRTIFIFGADTAYSSRLFGSVKMKVYAVEVTGKNDDGEIVTLKLIPCRLKKKISSYEAGKLAFDNATHKVGEIGFWDLNGNKFYGNAYASGSFTCELD